MIRKEMEMREIKFRYWDKEKCTMEHDFDLTSDGSAFTCSCGYDCDRVHEEKAIIMQFTGLNDKNGVEIYEGDKLTFTMGHSGRQHDGDVLWSDCTAGFMIEYAFIHEKRAIRSYAAFGLGIHEIEVIGNIHENPDLIG